MFRDGCDKKSKPAGPYKPDESRTNMPPLCFRFLGPSSTLRFCSLSPCYAPHVSRFIHPKPTFSRQKASVLAPPDQAACPATPTPPAWGAFPNLYGKPDENPLGTHRPRTPYQRCPKQQNNPPVTFNPPKPPSPKTLNPGS